MFNDGKRGNIAKEELSDHKGLEEAQENERIPKGHWFLN